MKKFLVEDVKVGSSKGGVACGPVSGSVIAEVCLRDVEDGNVKYHCLTEVEGIPNFFETDISSFDQQIEDDPDNEEFWEMLSEHSVGEYCDYYDYFDHWEEIELHDENHLLVWKLLVYLVCSDSEKAEKMRAECIGKYLGDFEVPVSDYEKEYQDDMAEEEEDNRD